MRTRYKLCTYCGQPMRPWRVKKKPNEFDHASGCPAAFNPHISRRCSICEKRGCDYERTGRHCDCPCHLLRGVALGATPFQRDHKDRINLKELRRWLLALEMAYGGTSWLKAGSR